MNNNKEFYTKSLREAKDSIESICKKLYEMIFKHIVETINSKIKNESKNNDNDINLYLLDIYGFEIFDNNSFEQLLINYANENLQRHFNIHVFEKEQEIYNKENIDWS